MTEKPANEAPPPLIEVQRPRKTVQDTRSALAILRDVSFTLAQRQTVAIVGASGSGKSTLLSLMAGQDLFAGDEDARAAIRARQLGFVFQNFPLMGGMTALENVMLPLELADAAATKRRFSRHACASQRATRPQLSDGWPLIFVCARAHISMNSVTRMPRATD